NRLIGAGLALRLASPGHPGAGELVRKPIVRPEQEAMMKKTLFSLSALSLSLLAGGSFAAVAPEVDPLANPPSPAFAGQTRASAAVVAHQVQVLASGLQQPRSLQALPDGRLLVA